LTAEKMRVTKDSEEVRTMKIEEIKQVVESRYGKFAETGGRKEPC